MSVLLILFGLFVAALALVAIEVACAIKQAVAWKPSRLIRLLAMHIGKGFANLGELLGRLADVPAALRNVALFIRRVFFAWIPVELVTAALRDLHDSNIEMLAAPFQFFVGLVRALCEASVPVVASSAFLGGMVVFCVAWEALFITYGWESMRLSTLIALGVYAARKFAWWVGYGTVAAFTDTWALAAHIFSTLLSIPAERARQAGIAIGSAARNLSYVGVDYFRGMTAAGPLDPVYIFFAMAIPLSAVVFFVTRPFRGEGTTDVRRWLTSEEEAAEETQEGHAPPDSQADDRPRRSRRIVGSA